MEKKIGLKNKTQTKKGERVYANAQTTLFSHPTRLKILEALRSGSKSTREIQKEAEIDDRMKLYYHLNLLVEEKIIKIIGTTKEKIYSLDTGSSKRKSLPISLKLEIPKNPIKKKEFFKVLGDLLDKSDYFIPEIDIKSLKTDEYSTLTLVLETKGI
ncbi:MAG: winged helix-turn-helix domain-containing protein [Candidatus Hodarchaeales archaeon]